MIGTENRIFEVIEEYTIEHEYVPTIDEIAELTPCSKSCAYHYYEKLLQKGKIATDLKGTNRRGYRVSTLKMVRREDNAKS